MSNNTVGVIHGRFQIVHLGHMEYLLAGKSRCQFLYVGIANPDPSLTTETKANPSRSLSTSNPFTYYERLVMIRESLLEAGVKRNEFEIVPFPINYPHLLKYYAPLNARFFMTIYDEWGREKMKMLKSLGLDVEVMWERTMLDRLTTGTVVRKFIANNEKWEHLVPAAVSRTIIDLGLDEKIRRITKDRSEA